VELWVARHGETEWARDLRHTGSTDVPLTEVGLEQAEALGLVLREHRFGRILTSPLQRSVETARLGGFPEAERTDLAVEWNYGEYEGLTTAEIREHRPGWDVWREGCPSGETVDEVGARCDALLDEIGEPDDDVLLFAHGHFLRVLAARYLGLRAAGGALLWFHTGSYSILGHERERRVIRRWNLNP
jgi:probable phosphoglycerate mutase